MKPPRRHWSWYALGLIVGISALGVVLGALVFPLVGLIFETGYSSGQLARNGMSVLGFYFAIWAPGIALVLTVKREYEARRARADPDSKIA